MREQQTQNGTKDRNADGQVHSGGKQAVGAPFFSPADIHGARLLETDGNHVGKDGEQHENGRGDTMGGHGFFSQKTSHDNAVDNAAKGIGQLRSDKDQHGLPELFPAEGGYVAKLFHEFVKLQIIFFTR